LKVSTGSFAASIGVPLTDLFTQNQWLNSSRKSDENTVAAAGQRRSKIISQPIFVDDV